MGRFVNVAFSGTSFAGKTSLAKWVRYNVESYKDYLLFTNIIEYLHKHNFNFDRFFRYLWKQKKVISDRSIVDRIAWRICQGENFDVEKELSFVLRHSDGHIVFFCPMFGSSTKLSKEEQKRFELVILDLLRVLHGRGLCVEFLGSKGRKRRIYEVLT